ncbi:hypothetical protein BC827DRAFT_1267137 [Russula dissimulans]|nr:hypothetical protein BC827DRAFT_1267137 [Russula dissimulans]
MSFLESSSLPNLFQDLNKIVIGKYFFLSVYTILLYDHLLTLPEKVGTSSISPTLMLTSILIPRYPITDLISMEEEEEVL